MLLPLIGALGEPLSYGHGELHKPVIAILEKQSGSGIPKAQPIFIVTAPDQSLDDINSFNVAQAIRQMTANRIRGNG
jgi:hypothetical protein